MSKRPDLDEISYRWNVTNFAAAEDMYRVIDYARELEAQVKSDSEIARLAREYMAAERASDAAYELWRALIAALSSEVSA